MLIAYSEWLGSTCGVTEIYGYEYREPVESSWYQPRTLKEIVDEFSEGTGFAIMGFIDTEECEDAYAVIKDKIVYQSPIRLNKNSDHNFFFVIIDTRK